MALNIIDFHCHHVPAVDHVVVGSDWPIAGDAPIRDAVANALCRAGLAEDERHLVATDNCRRLLGLSRTSSDFATKIPA